MAHASLRGQQGRAYTAAEIEERLRRALSALMADGTPFRSLTVHRIVGAAGLARSTFYLNFADKAAMLRALSASSLERLYAGARQWIRKGPEATRADIAAGLRQIIESFLEDEVVMRAVAEASVYEPSVRDSYIRAVEDYAGALERMIRKGVKEGTLRQIRPAATATAIAWMTERVIGRIGATTPPAELDALAEAMADMIWRTLHA